MKAPSTLFRFETFGLKIWRGAPPLMRRRHSHTEIELNLVIRGALTYRFAGESVVFAPGRLYVFSGLTPHELERIAPRTEYYFLTVPLAAFIRWRLPDSIATPILRGTILTDEDSENDARRFALWWDDLEGGDPRRARITLPEVQARLERMALSAELGTAPINPALRRRKLAEQGTLSRIEQMLHTIADRFGEPLNLKMLAARTQWHPHYAATQFRRWIGMPPGEFLLQQRAAHARHLLATSDAKVIEIAEECGFSTQSSFYAIFARITGQSPAAYRRATRREAG